MTDAGMRDEQALLRSLMEETLEPLHGRPTTELLLEEAFVVAVRRCFAGPDLREITTYVRDLLARRDLPHDGPRAREAEALIRAALGRPAATDGIRDDRRNGLMVLIIGDLASGGSADRTALLEGLVTQAGQRLDRLVGAS